MDSKSLFSDKIYTVFLLLQAVVLIVSIAYLIAEAAEIHLSKQEKAEEKKVDG